MYKLNVCLLSSVFEKQFSLPSFTNEYEKLICNLNGNFNFLNNEFETLLPESIAVVFRKEDYRLYRKLVHFFDDFNAFINESLKEELFYPTEKCAEQRLTAFTQRLNNMDIPQDIQDTVASFLTSQKSKISSANTEKDSWLVPKNFTEKWGRKVSLEELEEYVPTAADIDKLVNAHFKELLLEQLCSTCQKFPTLRLGQLILNSIPKGTDIFYVEDITLIQLLKNFEAQHGLSQV